MARPAVAAMRFVDCINHGDVDGMGRLMTADHELRVFDEASVVGRDANLAAWRGYRDAFPGYRIFPERALTLIWVADVVDGALRSWTLVEDVPANRRPARAPSYD